MNDAGMHGCLRENGGDRVRKTFETVGDGDQHVLDAVVPEPVHHARLELGALVLRARPENFLGASSAVHSLSRQDRDRGEPGPDAFGTRHVSHGRALVSNFPPSLNMSRMNCT